MQTVLQIIWTRLLTPDEFLDDWYTWMGNQCGHALLVGLPAALVTRQLTSDLWEIFVVVFVAYFIVWEKLIQRNHIVRDSMTDTFHVALGATILSSMSGPVWITLSLFFCELFLLFRGVSRRINNALV